MNNEKFVLDKQPVIREICLAITKHNSFTDDLCQWVSIWFLENEVDEIYLTDGFIHSVAYKAYHLSGSSFKREHIDNYSVIKEELQPDYHYPLESDNVDKRYEDLLRELTETERTWVEEIVKRNGSINLFSLHTEISRIVATERMNFIYNKLREANGE